MTVLVITDTETTGLDNAKADFVQLASVIWWPYTNEDTYATFNELAQPHCAIHPEAASVHGYTAEKLTRLNARDSAEVIREWASDIKEAVAGDETILVFHSRTYDIGILAQHIPGLLKKRWICTYIACSRLFPYEPTHKLEALYDAVAEKWPFELKAHDALSDCMMAFALLRRVMKERPSMSVADLADWCAEPEFREIFPIGKQYRGWATEDVPDSFLQWCLTKEDTMMHDIIFTARTELARRREQGIKVER